MTEATSYLSRIRPRDIIIVAVSTVLIVCYLVLNWQILVSGQARFLFTTIGVFVWLCLVMLYLIYDLCDGLRRDMGYTIEDNLVEIRLLRELTEKQIENLETLKAAMPVLQSVRKKR